MTIMTSPLPILRWQDMSVPLHDLLRLIPSAPFIPSLLAFFAIYHFLAPLYTTPKQLSWILTTVASATMVIASVPFVWDYTISGGNVKNVRAHLLWGYITCKMFQAYLVADLALGATYYRDQINLLTGWIHHVLYIVIVELAIKRAWTHIFCLCLLMELPTFILAIASLYPHLRSNVLFAVSFFATRIALHVVLCFSFFRSDNRAYTSDGSLMPSLILACIFPLHAMWFHGCMKGFVKRRREKKSSIGLATLDIASTDHGIVLSMDMPGSLYAVY